MAISTNRKIALIIAFRDFRDEEYFVPKEILEKAGFGIVTVSTKDGVAVGADGGETQVDITFDQLNIADYEGIFFIGGPGALNDLDNPTSYRIAKNTSATGKALGAICISPSILAKAGVLKSKRATVWSNAFDKSAINILKENGAIYEPRKVVIDGKIITANGPAAAQEFARAIEKLLSS